MSLSIRKATAVPDVADLFQEARMLSLTEEGITGSLKDADLEDTPENRAQMKLLICEELESTGNPSAFGMAMAREQHKDLQTIRRSEESYMINLEGGEEVLHEAEEGAGTCYKHRGVWKVRLGAADASYKLRNDVAKDTSEFVREIDPEVKAMQQSALSDLSEKDRIWLWEYESRLKSVGKHWTAGDKQRAYRLRKKVQKAVLKMQGL